jgi:hypothetical protein
VRASKAERVLAAGPDALRRAGRPLPAFHPVELLDASLSGIPAADLLRRARR